MNQRVMVIAQGKPLTHSALKHMMVHDDPTGLSIAHVSYSLYLYPRPMMLIKLNLEIRFGGKQCKLCLDSNMVLPNIKKAKCFLFRFIYIRFNHLKTSQNWPPGLEQVSFTFQKLKL